MCGRGESWIRRSQDASALSGRRLLHPVSNPKVRSSIALERSGRWDLAGLRDGVWDAAHLEYLVETVPELRGCVSVLDGAGGPAATRVLADPTPATHAFLVQLKAGVAMR